MSNSFNLYKTTAAYYDFDNRPKVKDNIGFYIKLFQANTQSVLELCCGTGRITIPLAKAGYNITGLDLSKPMLQVFKEKQKTRSKRGKGKHWYSRSKYD
ncbi:MAG: class I SAM-dependent methyltransferase [Chitinophagales bacterium]|nr:class I SAM-dependent methyltransferase [Chitinophagales bacterium]